jgi:hypothetical protein
MIERFRVFQLILLILHVTGQFQLHEFLRVKYYEVSAFTSHRSVISTRLSSRAAPTICYITTDNDDNNNDDDGNKKEMCDISDKPRYRSNLQRLIQATQAGQTSNKAPSKQYSNDSIQVDETEEARNQPKREGKNFDPYHDDIPFPPSNEEYSIDSFLRGEYDRPFSEDAAAPHPELSPSETIGCSLHALRELNTPEMSHGAAVFARFLAPLSRSERWGGSVSAALSPWKEIMRGSLTPTNFARRIRASDEFSVLLDWESIDVTEGLALPETNGMLGSTVAFVNAALFFRSGVKPSIVQFTLRRMSGVWLIESAVVSHK